MSRFVRFLRHAESEADAGLPSADPAGIPLTELGRFAAAAEASRREGPAPELIVVSPFLRAQETARPFRERFPRVMAEIWPVEEFTYLDPKKYAATTAEQRRPAAARYWAEAAPGDAEEHAESFLEFLERVRRTLTLLAGRDFSRALVVTHEQFIQAARWIFEQSPDPDDKTLVQRFFAYRMANPVPNLGAWELDLDDDRFHGSIAPGAPRPLRDGEEEAEDWDLDIEDEEDSTEEESLRDLEQLIRDSLSYRTAERVRELFQFLGRVTWHAPYNAMLLHIQKPDADLVLSTSEWAKLGRRPKPDARPLVILIPKGPVAFVFDRDDTEGDPLPAMPPQGNLFADSFHTEGIVPPRVWKRLLKGCESLGVELRISRDPLWLGGHIRRIARNRFRMGVNSEFSPVVRFHAVVHELAHLFCGHLGQVPGVCEGRRPFSRASREIEAEATAYLVAKRLGIRTYSERYLGACAFPGNCPPYHLSSILVAAGKIEALCAGTFRLRKPEKGEIPPTKR